MIPYNNEIDHIAKVYKALGEPTRIKIIRLMAKQDELSCAEISKSLNLIAGSTLSHHLKLLTECGLLKLKKVGVYHIYQIQKEALKHYAPAVIDY